MDLLSIAFLDDQKGRSSTFQLPTGCSLLFWYSGEDLVQHFTSPYPNKFDLLCMDDLAGGQGIDGEAVCRFLVTLPNPRRPLFTILHGFSDSLSKKMVEILEKGGYPCARLIFTPTKDWLEVALLTAMVDGD